MTIEEIRKILDNTKVYVNGKSKEIQEKLFSFGYRWGGPNPTKASFLNSPFLFIHELYSLSYSSNMSCFKEHKYREISADEILSLEITEPSYRPFKDKDECWNEMLKHQPFGWLCHKFDNYYTPIRINIAAGTEFESLFGYYNFVDGTPFGIKED